MMQAIEHLNPDTLSAFVDGELPDGEQEAIQQHLAGCHACALRVLSATELKAATARAGRRFAPPPETLARLTAQLRREPQGTLRIHSTRRVAWASLAAAMLLAVSLIGWRQLHRNQYPRRRTTRPAPRYPFQRSDPAGYLYRPPHRETLVSGSPPFQLQSSRRPGPSTGHDPQRRRPCLSQRAAGCLATVHDSQTSGLSLSYPTIRWSEFSCIARSPLGVHYSLSGNARSADRRCQRRQPRRSRCASSYFVAGAIALLTIS